MADTLEVGIGRPVQPDWVKIADYSVLYSAIIQDDWERVKSFLDCNPEARTAFITPMNETVLHVGVVIMSTSNIKKLLDDVPDETLSCKDIYGNTPLHSAALSEKLEAVKLLVARNPQLPNISDNYLSFPIQRAATYNCKDIFVYLLEVTKEDTTPNPFIGQPGNDLLTSLIDASLVELAIRLVDKYPRLAVVNVYNIYDGVRIKTVANTPLAALSRICSLFPSGTQHNFFERFIYKWIPLDKSVLMRSESTSHKRRPTRDRRNLLLSVWDILYRLLWNGGIILVPEIKRIKNAKEVHRCSLRLLNLLCKEVSWNINEKTGDYLRIPLLNAAGLGIHEVVEEILITYPVDANCVSGDGLNMIQLGVINRQHTIYNLLLQMSPFRKGLIARYQDNGNNILHMVAKLPPTYRLNVVPGAALQMQRELQWYRAVESISLPYQSGCLNSDDKRPADLFTDEHADLVKEGEKWMRDTSNSCTVAAALIATMAFAAGITMPGGNDSNSGFPIFATRGLFLAFILSNGISLFASSASLIMFLSLLTARYAEADFLYSLPRRLIFGLVALFISITTMMLTFSFVLFLTYNKNRQWTMAPLAALGVLPVALFAFLQFPLLVDIISSTYGRGIFRKQGNRLLF